ncbi:hypothetical protein [Sporosarcina sp. FSL K6-1508]|uniref:hypothetical protein n=1 Tax=Sporosarcina sp. FSL K6-1508 TaxID=2921553 RepID=UPI0030FBFC12
MVKESSSNSYYDQEGEISQFCERIREKNILAREMEFEYKWRANNLITRVDGTTTLALTPAFMDSVSQQLDLLYKEVITPLIERVQSNFVLTVKIDALGHFSLDDLKITFKIDLKQHVSLHESFRIPFRILIPFSEYIDYLSLRGQGHNLKVIEAEVNINKLDLLDVIDCPIAGPKAKEQWLAFAIEATAEAKKEHSINVIIPVSEGEVTWEIPHRRRMQHVEFLHKKKKK